MCEFWLHYYTREYLTCLAAQEWLFLRRPLSLVKLDALSALSNLAQRLQPSLQISLSIIVAAGCSCCIFSPQGIERPVQILFFNTTCNIRSQALQHKLPKLVHVWCLSVYFLSITIFQRSLIPSP
jgi:hypothetical protein